MQPAELQKKLERSLQNYIRGSLPLERAHPEFTAKLEDYLLKNPLLKDPFVEIVPPYETGATLQQLADAEIIRPKTSEIFANYFGGQPENIKLYQHQADAVGHVSRESKNLVVCSGTGSGKTETFLVPIIDYLVRAWEAEGCPERLSSGVRAMVLYPMNALVNDQIRRLRGVLKYAPFITFGRYIGDTEHSSNIRNQLESLLTNPSEDLNILKDATDEAVWGFDDEQRLANEVVTRDRWRDEPAHILVTNYSMLERLLLNPQQSSIFGEFWKFIVLDEAHSYTGALGTEIAWLIRRLKRRLTEVEPETAQRLQFLATSATLISDPDATPEEKCERIRNEFASRLFPAPAESFAVEFGRESNFTVSSDGHFKLRAEDYCKLIGNEDDGLLSQTQKINAEIDALSKLEVQISHAQEEKTLPLGDALAIYSSLHDASAAALIVIDEKDAEILHSSFSPLAGERSCRTVRALIRFAIAAVDELNQDDSWRELLHDPMDSRGSSEGQGTEKIGNRLHLRSEWRTVLDDGADLPSHEALSYLLKVTQEFALKAADEELPEISPSDLAVQLSQQLLDLIQSAQARLKSSIEEKKRIRESLHQDWKKRLNQHSFTSYEPTIERTLASFLQSDSNLQGAVSCLLEARARGGAQADDGRYSAVSHAVFGDDVNRSKGLSALFALATLAVPFGQRKPLLDVRYHQLMRGVSDVRTKFECGELREFVESQADDHLGLGICRECGQSFVLGYAETLQLPDQEELQLSPVSAGAYEYLHAFAWTKGALQEGEENYNEEENTNDWHLDTKRLSAVQNPENKEEFLPLKWHVGPADSSHKTFLRKCPNCGGANSTNSGARYGIITPYEATGTQLRVTALEELARLAAPSTDPAAKRQPGQGRKVLAFSDSRKGAARLAWQFEENHRRAVVERSIVEAVKNYSENNFTEAFISAFKVEPSVKFETIPENIVNFLPADKVQQAEKENLKKAVEDYQFQAIAILLCQNLESKNAGHYLEVASVDINGNPSGQLERVDAAKVLVLEALAKTGRNSLIANGKICVQAKDNCFNDLKIDGFTDDEARQCAQNIVARMLGRVTFNIQEASGWPRDLIHPFGYDRSISQKGGDNIHAFETGQGQFNRIARRAIARTLPQNIWNTRLIAHCRSRLGQKNQLWLENLDSESLAQLVRASVGSGPQDSRWLKYRKNQAQTLSDNQADQIRIEVNKFFREQYAGEYLHQIWPALVNENSILSAAGNSIYKLNPDALSFSTPNDNTNEELETNPAYRHEQDIASRELIPLRIEEHTAQLASLRGADYQKGFSTGNVNILSCSTTFEMGVDLGDLGCVFLGNLPPAMANYRQRAGRAGRRPGSPAYVLTLAGNSGHDLYYWRNPGELLFGPMDAPRIYLEHPVFRARHLRAEALRCFVQWLGEKDRFKTQGTDLTQEPPTPTIISRKPTNLSDFLIGRKGWRGHWTREFQPLTAELPDWVSSNADKLQNYLSTVEDVGNLDYQVARDFVWQLTGNCDLSPYPLDDLENLDRFRELGGCCLPDATDSKLVSNSDSRWKGLKRWSEACIQGVAGINNWDSPPTPYQIKLLQEEPLKAMTRLRVLPKYGFPVDVASLVPHENDYSAGNVHLERDLALAIYEYAPEQVVIADKKRFKSDRPLVYRQGGLQAMLVDQQYQQYICNNCHEPLPAGMQAATACPLCGGNLESWILVEPDGFQATRSTPIAGSGNYEAPGNPQHLYTGGVKKDSKRSVEKTSLLTGESNSGRITFLNMGPNYQGFNQGSKGARYTLKHEVYTDIAIWLPHTDLFADTAWLTRLRDQSISQPGGHVIDRQSAALQSALQALLLAIAKEKQISPREIAGVTYPDQEGGGIDFAFFDTASGGGGAVLDLVLGGNPAIDRERSKKILKIINKALELCEECPECNGVYGKEIPSDALIPVTWEHWITLTTDEHKTHRRQQSCYHCLRSFSNQRYHTSLDRYDAAKVLRELLSDAPQAEKKATKETEPLTLIPEGNLRLSELADELPEEFTLWFDISKPAMPLSVASHKFVRQPEGSSPDKNQIVIIRHTAIKGGVAIGKWQTMPKQIDGVAMTRISRLILPDGSRVNLDLQSNQTEALEWAALSD